MDCRTRHPRTATGWRILRMAAPISLSLSAAALAAPSWKPLPPYGGPVLALAAPEGGPFLYAGTETAGLSRSRNGGATWMPAQVPEPVRVVDLAVDLRDSKVAFAAVQTPGEEGAGVLRTLDGGAHWQPVNHGLGDEAPLRVQDLAVDPLDLQKLYAATEDGLFQTQDRGASWQRVGLDDYFIFGLAVDPFRPGRLFAAVYQNQTQDVGIFVSLDHGDTWAPSDPGIAGDPVFKSLAFHRTSPDTLFAFGNGWPTQVSRDGGATWTNLGQPLISLAFGPAGLLLGAPYDGNGVLKSLDGGLHWSPTGALPDRIAQLLVVNGRVYAAGRRGVWVSSDNGAHWQPSSRGLSARNIGDLVESGSTLYGSFAEGALASRTQGTSWRQLRDADHPEGQIFRFLAAGPGAIYALEQTDAVSEQIVRSTDGGASWSELASPGLGGTFAALAVDPRHPAILYAGSTEDSGRDFPPCHLARSVDTGQHWSCLATEASVSAIQVERATSTPYLIAAGNLFALAGGTTLTYRSTGLPANSTSDFAFDPRHAGTLYAATPEGVFKTTDGGTSWTRASRGLPDGAAVWSVAVDPHRRNVVYAGLQGQVYRSLDAGRTWRPFGNGLPEDAPIVELLPSTRDSHRLYAVAAGHGLFWQNPSAP